jgi:hypothetical protein
MKEMIQQLFLSEDENARSNFETVVYAIEVFCELGWEFDDFFISFEEMVLTIRKKLLEDNMIEDNSIKSSLITATICPEETSVLAIRQNVIGSKCETPILNNSYRRARNYIKSFSLKIFEMFKTFHDSKNDINLLRYSMARLWPHVDISKDEMENLISVLSKCIGNVSAEGYLLINLSGQGFLSLRDQLYNLVLSNRVVLEFVNKAQKLPCIEFVESFITNQIKKPFRFLSLKEIYIVGVVNTN